MEQVRPPDVGAGLLPPQSRQGLALREIFYDHFGKARPNKAHEVLAAWEARGLLKTLITQNIDNLHREAGIQDILIFPRFEE